MEKSFYSLLIIKKSQQLFSPRLFFFRPSSTFIFSSHSLNLHSLGRAFFEHHSSGMACRPLRRAADAIWAPRFQLGRHEGQQCRQGPDIMVQFIRRVRDAINGTILSVTSRSAMSTCGARSQTTATAPSSRRSTWLGTDLYPYYERDKGNEFSNSTTIFDHIYEDLAQRLPGQAGLGDRDGLPGVGPDLWAGGRQRVQCRAVLAGHRV